MQSGARVTQSFAGLEPSENCLGFSRAQRYYEIEIPPGTRGFPTAENAVVYNNHGCNGADPGAVCGSDYLNLGDTTTYESIALSLFNDDESEVEFHYDAVPIAQNATCTGRMSVGPGDTYEWDARSGYEVYSPCFIVEPLNAFYFSLQFPDGVEELRVQVDYPGSNDIGVSVQIVEDMIAQYYPQCAELSGEGDRPDYCVGVFDAYFNANQPADLVVPRPQDVDPSVTPSYLMIVHTGGNSYRWFGKDPRVRLRVTEM